ncbi:hypothetical protein [Sneathiella sp.]|uniref:hypothetical protein n=1 Tax=Sneathiella sp. TaxID=1964365 RepID=UPI0026310EFA|nr:hypothetical protein [Sneathiella sp.]MDF2366459.1 hypothetical protein [Sneathiella sp.]
MVCKVDLNTRILENDHKVYLARPGKGYRLYDEFLANFVVGPEMPGVDLIPGRVISNQPNLDLRLKKSIAIRKWLNEGRKNKDRPSDSINSYKSFGNARSKGQLLAVLKGYFEEMQQTDLLVIPPGAFAKQTLIAEPIGDPEDFQNEKFEKYFEKYSIPTRKIKVLSEIEKRALPSHVQDIIAKPNMLVLLGKSEAEFFYRLAYGNYTVGGNNHAKLRVTSESYDTTDDLRIIAFLNFVALNTGNISISKTGNVASIKEAAFADLGDFSPNFKSNINSPGWISLSSSYIIPLTTVALLGLAMSVGPDAVSLAENGNLAVINSSGPADNECVAEVHTSVIEQLNLLGLDRWQEACEIFKSAAEETGLETNVTVTKVK